MNLTARLRPFCAALLLAAAPAAWAQAGKVTVVTSFSKDVTDPVKKAFEKAVPGTMALASTVKRDRGPRA